MMDETNYFIKTLMHDKAIVVSHKPKDEIIEYLEENNIDHHCEMDDYFQYHIQLM